MANGAPPAPGREKGARGRGCCAFSGVLLLLAAVLIVFFLYRNRAPHFDLPEPAMPVSNAYQAFIRAGEQAQRLPHKSPYDLLEARQSRMLTPAYLAAFHQEAAPVLAAVRRGLTLPYRFPVDRSADTTLILHNYLFVRLEHVIAGEAIYDERIGQPDWAMETLLDGLELAVTIPRGGALLPSLVGAACELICTDQIEPLLARLSPAELSQAAARLDHIASKRVAFADVLSEEADLTAARQAAFLQDVEGVKSYDMARSLVGAAPRHAPTWGQWLRILGFCLADKTAMIQANRDYLRSLAAEARRPYAGPFRQRAPDNLLAPATDTFQTGWTRFLTGETILTLLRAEIALTRYHIANGRYPESLAQLVPAYLPSIPDDPFGGGAGVPLRYYPTEGGRGFRLYSLGAGMQDNHSRFTPNAEEDDPGNIVAGHLWRKPTLGVGSAED